MGETTWGKIAELASNGRIKIDDKVALDCAKKCADMAGIILGVQQRVFDIDQLKAFSPLNSGAELADRMSKRGSLLRDRMDSHYEILSEMMMAFVEAGKTYAEADGGAAGGFDNLTAPQKATDVFKEWGYSDAHSRPPEPVANGSISKAGAAIQDVASAASGASKVGDEYDVFGKSSDVSETEALGSAYSKASPGQSFPPGDSNIGYLERRVNKIESGSHLGMAELQNMRQEMNPSAVQYAAEVWGFLGSHLATAFGEFGEQLTDCIDKEPRWEGSAANKAVSATEAYVADAGRLTDQMQAMAANLSYTAWWLDVTWTKMPDPSQCYADEDEVLYDARNAVDVIYGPGIASSDGAIPELKKPTTPIAGSIDLEGNDKKNDGENGGGPGIPGGYPGGTGPGYTPMTPAGSHGPRPPDGGTTKPESAGSAGDPLGQLAGLAQNAARGAGDAADPATAREPAGAAPARAGAAGGPRMTPASALSGGSGKGAGGAPNGSGAPQALAADRMSKLFPRAGIPGSAATSVATPGGAPPAAKGGGGRAARGGAGAGAAARGPQ
uniref:PPE domain-containing protein n=1 Tax=Nocardia wallacei TaxID=480035 RepID=UPI003CC801BA